MIDMIRKRLTELKRQFGDYELTDEDYYESDDIASFDAETMFQYFRDELDEEQQSQLLSCAKESKLLLHDLIGVGETLIVDAEDASDTLLLSWDDLSGLASKDASTRQVTLARSEGLTLNLASMQVLAAESRDLDVTCDLPFGAAANIFKDDDQIVVKVTGKDSSLDGQLVGFCLSSSERDLLGFILLRAGVLGTVSGMTTFDRSTVSGEQTLNFSLVDNSDLCNADFPLLEKALADDLEDQRSVVAWRRWIDALETSEDGPGLAQPLDGLRGRLP